MTPLGFKGLDIRSRPLTFQAATQGEHAFTNSANRTVINSTVASTSQLSGGSCYQAEAPALGPHSRWGFCSFILAADALALPPKCDDGHIEQFALVREFFWPGGEASKSALLPRCVLRAGLFF
jgi:hypothetical protein